MGKYDKSNELFGRSANVIPGGIPGHQSPTLLVFGSSPCFIDRAEGSRFWDVDGNEYIDYMCAYGPMVLGYNHPKVEQAARAYPPRLELLAGLATFDTFVLDDDDHVAVARSLALQRRHISHHIDWPAIVVPNPV